MLTGIGADGTKYTEGVTFASELALGEESPTIELPNDAEPAGEPLTFRRSPPIPAANVAGLACPR